MVSRQRCEPIFRYFALYLLKGNTLKGGCNMAQKLFQHRLVRFSSDSPGRWMLTHLGYACGIAVLSSVLCSAVVQPVAPVQNPTTSGHDLSAPIASAKPPMPALDAYGTEPLSFEENRGQAPRDALFLARTHRSSFLLQSDGLIATLDKTVPDRRIGAARRSTTHPDAHRVQTVRLRFSGSTPQSTLVGTDELPTKTNYYSAPVQEIRSLGRGEPVGAPRDPGLSASLPIEDVPNFKRLTEKNIYPGVDLVYYGNGGELEYDFVVAPGAKTEQIHLKFSGVERLKVSRSGDLVLHTRAGDLNQLRPRVYESTAAGKREIDGSYVLLARDEVGFRLQRHSPGSAVVIDPVLDYSTYFGNTADEQAKGVGVDSAGNAYIAGTSSISGTDTGFVSKYSPTGKKLFTTYIGNGKCTTDVFAIAVDAAGNSYLTGLTEPFDASTGTCVGSDHVLATKVTPDGTTGPGTNGYNTYFPGGGDQGNGIAVDAAGNAYITGQESSTSMFPITQGAFMTHTSSFIGFVSKIDPTATYFVYSTFLGGTATGDTCNAIAVDKYGNAYITGYTVSSDFPLRNPYQSKTNTFYTPDAFFTVLNAAGSGLNYSTYLGGREGVGQGDSGNAVAIDSAGNAYIAGETTSPDFPVTAGAYDKICGTDGLCNPTFNGTETVTLADAFVAKFDPALSGTASLIYSTYLGGDSIDKAYGIAVDRSGNAYITGFTISADFPTLNALHSTYIGGDDIFVTELNATGSQLLFSTYFGGTGDDDGNGIALDSSMNVLVAGSTTSTNFPVVNAAQPVFGGGSSDAFLLKIGTAAVATALKSLTLTPSLIIGGQASKGTVTLTSAAPAGGAVVKLASSVSAVAKVPTSVTVPAGASSATFSATASFVAVPGSTSISASYDGDTQSVTLMVKPVAVSRLSISAATVVGGTLLTGTVTLNAAAPTGGTAVTLSSSNHAAATVPAEVIVAAGKTSATFAIETHAVSAAMKATISASHDGSSSAILTVDPPVLYELTLAPASVKDGSPSIGTVKLTGIAPTGGSVVTLSSSNHAAATVPAEVIVAAGKTSATFTIKTYAVSRATTATISARDVGVRNAVLTVDPPTLSALSLTPTSVSGGSRSTGTVELAGIAPTAGIVIALSSSNTSVATVPASVTVKAGATSALFTVTTKKLNAKTSVTISGAYAGVKKVAALTVVAP
jgi:hypothetical protein